MTKAQQKLENRPRVLVVDDSRVMRTAVRKVLESEFDVVEAQDGEDGWSALGANDNVQVVISDVQMPRLDGYGMVCRMRAADHIGVRNVPVIVMTGAEDDITRERAFACGANDFIVKPIDGPHLLASVRSHAQTDAAMTDLDSAPGAVDSRDPVTQLGGRRFFVEHARARLESDPSAGDLALVRMTLDRFSTLRDQRGDDEADQILVAIARRLHARTRGGDVLARTGPAEFSLLAQVANPAEAAVLGERLRAVAANEPVKVASGACIAVTVSIGMVVPGDVSGTDLEEWMAAAHRRLKLAQAAGGDRSQSSDTMVQPVVEETVMEAPGVDAALGMLERGEYANLGPYALELANRVLPLLEYCNREFVLNLDADLDSLREQLSK